MIAANLFAKARPIALLDLATIVRSSLTSLAERMVEKSLQGFEGDVSVHMMADEDEIVAEILVAFTSLYVLIRFLLYST